MCISESLRLNPPVEQSSDMCLSETVEICGIRILKGVPFSIAMGEL